MTMLDTAEFVGEIHPAAEAWPLLPDDELDALAASIAEIGLQDPITLDPAGRLLDGRNRLRACEQAGVSPEFVTYAGDPVPFILAKNGDRRHMTTGAKAMTTAVVLAEAGYRKGGRWQYGVIGNPESGKSEKSWQNVMSQAGQVIDFVPAMAEKVIAGDMALDAAVKEAKRAKQQAESDDERMKRLKADAPDLAAKVASGDLSLGEAEAAHQEREREHAEAVKRHAKYLTDSVTAWDHLLSVAEGRFAHFDDAVQQVPDSFRERLAEATAVIKKGLR